MKEVFDIASQQLEQTAKALKFEVEKVLDEKVESLKQQIGTMAEIEVPVDVLKLYIESGGKVWVSKRVWINDEDDNFNLQHGGRYLFYANPDSRKPDFVLPRGAYKLVLIAIPVEFPESHNCDDYGYPVIK